MKVYFQTFTKKWVKPLRHQFPTGSRVYKGFQGSGKTLSLVFDSFQLQKQFPRCLVYSNVHIKGLNNFHYIDTDEDLAEALTIGNGADGVLVILDEAHLYFGRKSGIPLDVLTAISQQRKDRRSIWFTSQIWEELDISLRKQVKEIVNCRCFFGMLQFNTFSDGETLSWDKMTSQYVAKSKGSVIFKHSQALYNSYDTYQKIISNKDYARSYNTPNIVYNDTSSLRGNKKLR